MVIVVSKADEEFCVLVFYPVVGEVSTVRRYAATFIIVEAEGMGGVVAEREDAASVGVALINFHSVATNAVESVLVHLPPLQFFVERHEAILAWLGGKDNDRSAVWHTSRLGTQIGDVLFVVGRSDDVRCELCRQFGVESDIHRSGKG